MQLEELLSQRTILFCICTNIEVYNKLFGLSKVVNNIVKSEDFLFLYKTEIFQSDNGYETFRRYRKGKLHSLDDGPCETLFFMNYNNQLLAYRERPCFPLVDDLYFCLKYMKNGEYYREKGPHIISMNYRDCEDYLQGKKVKILFEMFYDHKNNVFKFEDNSNVRKYYIEKDGKMLLHNENGPALIRKMERNNTVIYFVEYYSEGVRYNLEGQWFYKENLDDTEEEYSIEYYEQGSLHNENVLAPKKFDCDSVTFSYSINGVKSKNRFSVRIENTLGIYSIEKQYRNNFKRRKVVKKLYLNGKRLAFELEENKWEYKVVSHSDVFFDIKSICLGKIDPFEILFNLGG